MLQVITRLFNVASIKSNVSVIMAKNIQIIRIQSLIIMVSHLVILITKFLLLVEMQTPLQLNYLISIQMHGQPKLHFLTAPLRKIILKLLLGWHMFSVYWYGLVSRQSSVLIIGPRCDTSVNHSLIAKYTQWDKWERVGNLQHSRTLHRAIGNGDRIYVVGGSGMWSL